MARALACCGGADGINRALHLQHPRAALALLPTLALLPQRPRVSQLKRPTPAPRPARRPVRASCISLSLNPMGLLGRFCDARGLLKRGGGPVVGGRSEPPVAPWTAPYTPNARISSSHHPPYGTVAASAAPIGPRLAASPHAPAHVRHRGLSVVGDMHGRHPPRLYAHRAGHFGQTLRLDRTVQHWQRSASDDGEGQTVAVLTAQ